MTTSADVIPFTSESHSSSINFALAGATTLRALMKNHPEIRQSVFETLRDRVNALGVSMGDDVWRELVVANASELEHSKAHVIE